MIVEAENRNDNQKQVKAGFVVMIRRLQQVLTFATKDFDKMVLVCFILANKHSQSKVYEYCSAVDGTKCQMKCPGSVLYS